MVLYHPAIIFLFYVYHTYVKLLFASTVVALIACKTALHSVHILMDVYVTGSHGQIYCYI
jgi:hypothetical protein